jgi:hypothetical protein
MGHLELEQAFWCAESSLLAVLRMHFDLPVSTDEVQGAEPARVSKCVECVVDSWERKGVFASNRIEFSVINAKPKCAILLLDQHDWRCPWAVEIGVLYWSGLAVLTGQTGVPEIGSIVATEVCLYSTTVSEPGLSRRTGKPFEEGVTKALATHTGSFLVQACSRMHGCAGRGGSRLLWVGTHASSQAGGILTVSTRATVIGKFGAGCGCIKGIYRRVPCDMQSPLSHV